MAIKYNLIGQKVGKLTVERLLEKEERPTQTHGNYWLCKCECGNFCKVPTSYLTGNGNYTQKSCGCDRKKKAFQSTSYIDLDDEYLEKYMNDFEKYLLLHKALRVTQKDLLYYNSHIEEYKNFIEFFWEDKQFNAIYNFWQK